MLDDGGVRMITLWRGAKSYESLSPWTSQFAGARRDEYLKGRL